MIYSADISQLREAAKQQIMFFHVNMAESDRVPAQLRAMYVLKLQEAKRVLADEESSLISREAAMRGVTPRQLATLVVSMSEESSRLELSRMNYNVRIESASSETEIVEILAELGLSLSVSVESSK